MVWTSEAVIERLFKQRDRADVWLSNVFLTLKKRLLCVFWHISWGEGTGVGFLFSRWGIYSVEGRSTILWFLTTSCETVACATLGSFLKVMASCTNRSVKETVWSSWKTWVGRTPSWCLNLLITRSKSQRDIRPTRRASSMGTIAAQSAKAMSSSPSLHHAPTSFPLSPLASFCPRPPWLCNNQLLVVIECKMYWLLFKGEPKWHPNGLLRVRLEFIYWDPNTQSKLACAPLPKCLTARSTYSVCLRCFSGVIGADRHLYQSPRTSNIVEPPPLSTRAVFATKTQGK